MTTPDESPLSWVETQNGSAENVQVYISALTLHSGERIDLPASGVTVVVGANNSGKSTFLRQLNVFLQTNTQTLALQQPELILGAELTRETKVNDLIKWLLRHATYLDRRPSQGGPQFAINGMQISTDAVRGGAYSASIDTLQDLHAIMVSFADATSRLSQPFQSPARSLANDPPTSPFHKFQDNRQLFSNLSSLSEKVFGKPLLLDDFSGSSIQIRVGSVDIPIPARNEPLGEFGHAVGMLPTLTDQGDGMRSFFGLMIPALVDGRKIILVDEPEAFLHPPQARALGRELSTAAITRNLQVIVSTHSKEFISGVLDSEASLTVVRLIRTEGATRRAQLTSETLRAIGDDRNLRYSNVLNGLFTQLVVICESDQDCRFYEAALDHYVFANAATDGVHTIPASDVLFLPSSGKGGFASLIPVLKQLAVPTVVIPDIDLLKSRTQTKQIFEMLGGLWSELDSDYTIATAGMNSAARPRKVRIVLETIQAVLDARLKIDPGAAMSREIKDLVNDQLNAGVDPWAAPKKSGVAAFSGDARSSLEKLMFELDRRGLILVQVGELEGFSPTHPKNKEWLPKALIEESHKGTEASALIRRILQFHASTLALDEPLR